MEPSHRMYQPEVEKFRKIEINENSQRHLWKNVQNSIVVRHKEVFINGIAMIFS